MALERIIGKIKKDAEKKRKEIIGEAEKKREEILKEARKKSEEILKRAEEEKEKLKEARVRSFIGAKKIELNAQLLKKKRQILDEVYKEAFTSLRGSEHYLELIKFLLELLVEKGDEEIILPKNDERITKDFIIKINREKKWNLRISERKADIEGGFLLKSKKREIDASMPRIMEIIKEETEVEVSKILFHD